MDDETEQRAWFATVAFADKHKLSVYDAAYLELAKRKALPLATFDGELIHAAQHEGIDVLGYS